MLWQYSVLSKVIVQMLNTGNGLGENKLPSPQYVPTTSSAGLRTEQVSQESQFFVVAVSCLSNWDRSSVFHDSVHEGKETALLPLWSMS